MSARVLINPGSDRSVPPDPLDVLRAWPANWPLACTWSSPADDPPPADIAHAQGVRNATPGEPCWTIIARAGETREARTLEELEHALARHAFVRMPSDRSPCSGWIGSISYDLGRVIEPASVPPHTSALAREGVRTGTRQNTSANDRPWPLILLRRIECALMFDHAARTWWAVDDERGELESLLHSVARSARDHAVGGDDPSSPGAHTPGFTLAPPNADANRAIYMRGVEQVLAHLAAGDAYQVNLAHRLSCEFSGSARSLFAALARSARPRHGAYLEADTPSARIAIASASPELFVRYDPVSRTLLTRPMKGTRPGDTRAGELLASEKDRAELTMITDLMRNDLGRVAVTGSVRVISERTIERHGTSSTTTFHPTDPTPGTSLLQATSTIACTLRPGLGLGDVLRATFPPGSVTGAPKVSAMRIIESLEPARRGPYCGTIGFFGDDGGINLSVTIRSACISAPPLTSGPHGAPQPPPGLFDRATLDYSVGAGIVADSVAQSEWDETLVKARTLFAVLSAPKG